METREITLIIPKHQRLGESLMNAYRGQWDGAGYPELDVEHGYWDIWGEDVGAIQEKIFKMNV